MTGIDGARSKGISPESGTGLGCGHRFNCKVSMGYPHIPMDTQQITIPKSGEWISPSISWLRFDVLISNHSASVLMNIPILSVCPHHIHFAVHYPVLIQANDPLPNKKEASKLAINIHSLQVLLVKPPSSLIHLGKLQRPRCDLTGIMVNKGNHTQDSLISG